jgi:uncharacterized membrane protein YgdD (TMEM256/DUF423 family)
MFLRPDARGWIAVAALSGALSVAFGAFAAHGFDPSTSAGLKSREWLETGSRYQALHALAMLAVCTLGARLNATFAGAALGLFLAGSVLFPGGLYVLALGGPRWMGAVAPLGGTAFIVGWLSFAFAAVRRSS